jgi:hypothetical protein
MVYARLMIGRSGETALQILEECAGAASELVLRHSITETGK